MADAEIRKEEAEGRTPLLQVDHLKTHFDVTKGLFSPKQIVKAVDDVSFCVGQGETYGLVGESGCGKSTLGRTLVKIYPATGGKVLYKGQDIARLGKEEEKRFRRQAAEDLHCQDPGPESQVHHLRRAHFGAGRFHPGPDHQSFKGDPGRAGDLLPVRGP